MSYTRAVNRKQTRMEARTALLDEFGAFTAAVAEQAGVGAVDGLVAVEHNGTIYYPGFQFDVDGSPKRKVAEVLKHLGPLTPWQQALWFTTANGWLDGRRPVDVLDNDGGAVLAAAVEALREPVG